MQDTEKGKVLQSIASVIQALPAEEEIQPVEVRIVKSIHKWALMCELPQAIVNPIISKLYQALQSSAQVRLLSLLLTIP